MRLVILKNIFMLLRSTQTRLTFSLEDITVLNVFMSSDILLILAIKVTLLYVFATPCKYCEDYRGDPD